MPKKSTTARGGAQRQKPKAQKSFELVRPVTPVGESVETTEEQIEAVEEQTVVASTKSRRARRSANTAVASAPETTEKEEEKQEEASPALTRGSAAARIAARRQAVQRVQQRSAQSLLSPEHFAYVTRDLVTIAVLACLMLIIIIALYFVIGRTI